MPKNTPEQLREVVINVFQPKDIAVALSTGTPGPFRKITAMIMNSEGKILGFAKIGETQLAIERIKNEANMLKHIALSSWFKAHSLHQPSIMSHERSTMSIKVPDLLYEGEIDKGYLLIQTPASFEGKIGPKEFNQSYAGVLSTLINRRSVKFKFNESEFYERLRKGVESYPLSYRDILKNGLRYLEENLGNEEMVFSLSHGDFAPWNMLWNQKEVFIYDWESACLEAPAGIDLVHFLFQTGFLLKKLRGEKLLRHIMHTLTNQRLNKSLPLPESLILLYLLHMAVTEDEPQQLSTSAVERRKLIKMVIAK